MQGTILRSYDLQLTATYKNSRFPDEVVSVPVTLRQLGKRRFMVTIYPPNWITLHGGKYEVYLTLAEAEATYARLLLTNVE